VHCRTSIFVDGVPKKPISRPLSERRIVVQVADDLAAQRPQVVHVLTNGFG